MRDILKPNGILRKPSEDFLERLLSDMALTIRTEVRHNFKKVDLDLHEREREMRWLREQLRDFLTLHGIDAAGNPSDNASNVRHSMEQVANISDRLGLCPATYERFRSTQAEKNPFTDWDKRYNEKFLPNLKLTALKRLKISK